MMSDADLQLRNLTYARFVQLGRAPTPAEIAAASDRSPAEVIAGGAGSMPSTLSCSTR
jgi:hypothetical protein